MNAELKLEKEELEKQISTLKDKVKRLQAGGHPSSSQGFSSTSQGFNRSSNRDQENMSPQRKVITKI